jgi:hypothetical protein
MNKPIFSFLLSTLLAGGGLAARAQTGAEAKPVTLNVSQVPLQTALKMLFTGTGLRFVIDPDVPFTAGVGSLSLSGVPFPNALKQVLGAVNPPLVAELRGGVYHIQAAASAPPEADVRASLPPPTEDAGQNNFYKIGINHYDAGVIADAMTRRGGIILLPPNFVIPANSAMPGTLAGPNVTTVGGARGLGMTAPNNSAAPLGALGVGPLAANAMQAGPLAAANVLPPGVKRIFVLESDNSLVIEATSQGYDNLTGEGLVSRGYTQVY